MLLNIIVLLIIFSSDRFKQCHAVEVSNHFELLKASRAAGRDFCPNSYIENKNEQNDCSCLSEISIRCSGTPQLVNFDNGTISIGIPHIISTCMKNIQSKNVRQIIFCGWSNETFDPMILTHFPRLRTLRIESGAISKIDSDFPKLKNLKFIRIAYTRLARIKSTLFAHLPNLSKIDLRWNQLDYYDGSLKLPKKVQRLYLSENPFNCSKNFKWILNYSKSKHVIDRNVLQCGDNLFKNQSIVVVMNIKMSLREICNKNIELRNCTCILSYISLDLNGVRRPMYSINCNHLNLYRLPKSLPENTTTFYAQHNKISNIEPLLNTYRNVHDIYLDYNRISTIEILETNKWLERFRAFSLKGNELKKLPVYLFNNALEKNVQASALYLSKNPWRCECNFMLRFQELLQRHRAIIKDVNEIQCSKQSENEDEVYFYSVLALKRSDVCILSTEYAIKPIDILNIILALLIILIVAKLSFDCYNYRKNGYLPWIVTKMP